MSCALSSDSPFHIIPPRVLESRERLRHVTVIIFLSADKDMDCRGSALILHAPLPTSTLSLFSTEAKDRVNQPAWWLVWGHVVFDVLPIRHRGRLDFFIHQHLNIYKKNVCVFSDFNFPDFQMQRFLCLNIFKRYPADNQRERF